MNWRAWTGVGERRWKTTPDEHVEPSKTLWDWLQLLIVPAILVGVTFAWNASQDTRDKNRADEVRQDATLNAYLKQMSDLMLNNKLLSSKPGDSVRSVARTVTLTTLRRLDAERRGEVVTFLAEANLIAAKAEDPVVSLSGATLTRAELADAALTGADLTYADLAGAQFTGASLASADLEGADLTGADLKAADLTNAHLTGADLTNARVTDAFLMDADLTYADLTGADFKGANLGGADLKHAKIKGARLEAAKDVGKKSHYSLK